MQAMSSVKLPAGMGGFLNPESVAGGFGITQGMSVSDFGCGAGYFTISLAERVGPEGRVYALDVVEYALDSVRSKSHVAGLKNIETIRANLEVSGSSGLADNSQDVVLMANILFQSNKRANIIKEGKRILKNGGKMILIDWKKGNGGFGPPDGIKPDKEELMELAEKEGLVFESMIDAGQFHFGLGFKKP